MNKYNDITEEELDVFLGLLRDKANELCLGQFFLGELYEFDGVTYDLFNALLDKAEGISGNKKRQVWDKLMTLHKQVNSSKLFQERVSYFHEIIQHQHDDKTRNYPTSRRLTQYATRQEITAFCDEFKTNVAVTLNFNPEMWGNQSVAQIRTNVGNILLPKIIGAYRSATVQNGSREKIAYIGVIEHLRSNVHVHLAVYNPKFKSKDLSYDAAKEEAFLLTDALIKKTGGGSAFVAPLLNPAGWAAYITKTAGCCENLVFDPFSKSRLDKKTQ